MNKVKVKKFIKKKVSKTELKEVFKIAKKIENFLNKEETSKKIFKLNVKNVVSQKIQKVITDFVVPELGFKSEKEDLFKKYETNKLRPDFFLKVRETGILLEVEKGKTITNNMDLFSNSIINSTYSNYNIFTIGYLENPIGYIPDVKALNEGGYETDRSIKYFGLQQRFSNKIQEKIIEGFQSMQN